MLQLTNEDLQFTSDRKVPYAMDFSLHGKVADLSAANDWLREQSDLLSKRIQQSDAVSYVDGSRLTLDSKIHSLKWEMLTPDSGQILITANSELTETERKTLTEWINNQNVGGIGDQFCQ